MRLKDPVFAVYQRFAKNKAEYRDLLQCIKLALGSRRCSSRAASCFRWYYFYDLTMDEIGKKLSISKSTVSRHIKRAVEACRESARRWGDFVG